MSGERKLHGFQLSPPVRTVLLTLKALELDYTFVTVNTFVGEQNTPEYLAKNPQHTVPTLEEPDGTCIWDSHAICAYLVRRYGKDDTLYPKDFYKRAVVDQRLHYENGVVFTDCLRTTLAPLLRDAITKEQFQEKIVKANEIYKMLETFLGENKYIACNELTIADFSLITSLSSLVLVAPIDDNKFPKLAAWFERTTQLPYFAEANVPGNNHVKDLLKDKLEKYL